MVIIRLLRVGRKNHAEFRVVATESKRAATSANYIESLGFYNPHTGEVTLQDERVKRWIASGAQVSGTVHNILVSKKLINGPKRNVLPKKTAPAKEATEEASAAAEATPATTEAVA